MRDDCALVTLLRATRLERTLMPISFIMITVSFANKINYEILLLALCCVLIYVSGGILNAKVDNDFKIKNAHLLIFVLIITAIIISLTNYIIFLSVISWIILSFVYSKYSRKIIFGDSAIIAITHAAIPSAFAGLLLNLNTNLIITITIFSYAVFFMFVPIKNVKGVNEDIQRKYKTIMTMSKNGKVLTYTIFNFYFISMFLAFFIFNLGNKFLIIFSAILILKIPMDYYLYNKNEILTYKFARLVVILFSFAFIVDKTTNFNLILISFSTIIIYMIYLVNDIGEYL